MLRGGSCPSCRTFRAIPGSLALLLALACAHNLPVATPAFTVLLPTPHALPSRTPTSTTSVSLTTITQLATPSFFRLLHLAMSHILRALRLRLPTTSLPCRPPATVPCRASSTRLASSGTSLSTTLLLLLALALFDQLRLLLAQQLRRHEIGFALLLDAIIATLIAQGL